LKLALNSGVKEDGILKSQAEIFLEYANPHAWWLSAHDLHDQTKEAYIRRGKSKLTKIDAEGKVLFHLDGIDRSCFLLGGFSLENIIKSLVVFENPNFVANSKLAKELKSHDLLSLAQMVSHFTLTQGEIDLVGIFSKATVSWARYPCALNFHETKSASHFTADVYETYELLFARLDKATKESLAKGWTGPFGFYGKFKFDDQMS
jgi:hypothetical protein